MKIRFYLSSKKGLYRRRRLERGGVIGDPHKKGKFGHGLMQLAEYRAAPLKPHEGR